MGLKHRNTETPKHRISGGGGGLFGVIGLGSWDAVPWGCCAGELLDGGWLGDGIACRVVVRGGVRVLIFPEWSRRDWRLGISLLESRRPRGSCVVNSGS